MKKRKSTARKKKVPRRNGDADGDGDFMKRMRQIDEKLAQLDKTVHEMEAKARQNDQDQT